jgi:hypothetical protein
VYSRKALGHKRDGNIFVLVEIQCTYEPARLVGCLDLDLHVTLHVTPCCKLGSLGTIRFAFFGCVARSSGSADPYWISFLGEKKTLKRRVALTAKYESEYLIVFGEEDPMRDVRSNKKKVDMTGGLLES